MDRCLTCILQPPVTDNWTNVNVPAEKNKTCCLTKLRRYTTIRLYWVFGQCTKNAWLFRLEMCTSILDAFCWHHICRYYPPGLQSCHASCQFFFQQISPRSCYSNVLLQPLISYRCESQWRDISLAKIWATSSKRWTEPSCLDATGPMFWDIWLSYFDWQRNACKTCDVTFIIMNLMFRFYTCILGHENPVKPTPSTIYQNERIDA